MPTQGENGNVPDPSGEIVDQATFSQILEMDDDEDERDFSKSIVYDFFEQARNTFEKMDTAQYVTFRLRVDGLLSLISSVEMIAILTFDPY